MASSLLCDGSCHAAANPSDRDGSNNKRRRRCFSSVPLQPTAVPPSSFSSAPAPAAGRRRRGEAVPSPPSQVPRSPSSRCPTRRAGGIGPAVCPAAGCTARATAVAPLVEQQHEQKGEEEGRLQLLLSPRRRRRRRHQRERGDASAGSRGARGLLSRVATAAVTAAAVSACAPVGVGALMTEEQCKDATFRGTPAELGESPRPDTVTEAAAAGIDRTIVASQATYDRMVLDQASITIEEGLDVPFRNLWSDHVWLKTAQVTFTDVATMGLFGEGTPPAFNCMNEYYGLTFERGDAVVTPVYGVLEADKVLNWDVLGPDYLALEGLDSFVPTGVQTVTSTTSLVAAREDTISEEFGAEFSEDTTPNFHYFLSVPAEDVDPSACPEPCTGEVVTYYWSQAAGAVYLLDRVSAVAETQPCWLELFQAVEGGPPADGVSNALWEATGACTAGLLQAVEDAIRSGEYSPAASVDTAGAVGDGDDGATGGGAAVAAAVLIPALLVSFAVVAFGLLRHQKGQRLKKMKTTDEAWGEGLDGGGERKPRPPTGRFKLGVACAAVAAAAEEGGGGVAATGGIVRLKSFPPPERVFTDVSIDDQDVGVGITAAAAGAGRRDEEAGRVPEDEEEDEDGEDMIYPM